jgi:hypothetical protein
VLVRRRVDFWAALENLGASGVVYRTNRTVLTAAVAGFDEAATRAGGQSMG